MLMEVHEVEAIGEVIVAPLILHAQHSVAVAAQAVTQMIVAAVTAVVAAVTVAHHSVAAADIAAALAEAVSAPSVLPKLKSHVLLTNQS